MLSVIHESARLTVFHVEELCAYYRLAERICIDSLKIFVRSQINDGLIRVARDVRLKPFCNARSPEFVEDFPRPFAIFVPISSR